MTIDRNFSKRFKPCLLVTFGAHSHRAHDYKVEDKTAERLENGTEVSSWKTTKTVQDPEAAKEAASLRSRFIHDVTHLGVQYGNEKLVFVDFERQDDIDLLVKEWQVKLEEFNQKSKIVKLDFFVLPPLSLTGSNEYFLGKLLDELKDTMGNMREALQAADYKGVRSIVARLKGFISVVPDDSAVAIKAAINDARKQARMIKRELDKRGTAIEEVQKMVSTSSVDVAVSVAVMEDDLSTEASELVQGVVDQQYLDDEANEDEESVAVQVDAPMIDDDILAASSPLFAVDGYEF